MFYRIGYQEDAFYVSKVTCLLPEPHMHSHLELIYIAHGYAKVFLDTKEYLLQEGDLFISFPNQIHFYHHVEPIEGYLIIFEPNYFRELKELFKTHVPEHPILHKEMMPENIHDLLRDMRAKKTSDLPLAIVAAKGLLMTLLADILPRFSLREHSSDQNSVKRILVHCMEHYLEPITLESIAKDLYLNKCYISHVFNERLNISFKDFINHMRVENARKMLEKGTNITEIAFSSGFASIRTFNRAFQKHLGMTPREYMKTNKKKTS